MPSHPCADRGLSAAHIRAFHGIATGLRRGLDATIVRELLANDLLRGDAAIYTVPEPILEQLADWIEQTAAEMNAETNRPTETKLPQAVRGLTKFNPPVIKPQQSTSGICGIIWRLFLDIRIKRWRHFDTNHRNYGPKHDAIEFGMAATREILHMNQIDSWRHAKLFAFRSSDRCESATPLFPSSISSL